LACWELPGCTCKACRPDAHLGGVDCSSAEMAANDIFLWKAQAAETLPAGDVTIVLDNAVVPPSYAITVSWNEPGEQPTFVITVPVLGI